MGVVLLQTPLHKKAGALLADWLLDRATDKFMADDMDGALADLDRAVAWSTESPAAFALRAEVRLAANDLTGSLADCNKLIGLTSAYDPAIRARTYLRRAHVYQRMERHEEAIADATRSVELSGPWDAVPLNSRAYIRAIANVELEQGLVDVEKALRIEENNPAYLDTRAYLLFLLARYQPALVDMNRAIEEAEANNANEERLFALRHRPRQKFALRIRLNDENLAVMYHHRGQIHEKLGNSEQAQADLRRGDELGYNPATGVY